MLDFNRILATGLIGFALAFSGGSLIGCDDDVEDAAENVKDAAEDTADKVKDAAEDAADKVKDVVD